MSQGLVWRLWGIGFSRVEDYALAGGWAWFQGKGPGGGGVLGGREELGSSSHRKNWRSVSRKSKSRVRFVWVLNLGS